MSVVTALLLTVAGLVILGVGGEALVRGATAIARLAGLTTAVIGLTVVALGTSLPELMVSLLAALRGTPDIALGNVVGSNIANIGLILGLTSLLFVLPIHGSAAKLEWPFMFVASWVALLLARDGAYDRLEGGFFVVSLVLFLAFMIQESRTHLPPDEIGDLGRAVGKRSMPGRDLVRAIAAVVLGSGSLFLGARFLVDGASALAAIAGIPDRIIGLTVVAVGTSLPELAASLVAARRKQADVAVANIIGSNIFNLLAIFGVTALVRPIPVSAPFARVDMWWMIGFAFLLMPMLRYRSDLSRTEGGILLGAYIGYLVMIS